MEGQNKSIENSKHISESSANTFQKIGINISLWPSLHTMDHSVMKQTPFFLMYGSEPTGFPTALPKMNVPAVETRISKLLKARDNA